MKKAVTLEKIKKILKGDYINCPCKIKGSCKKNEEEEYKDENKTDEEYYKNDKGEIEEIDTEVNYEYDKNKEKYYLDEEDNKDLNKTNEKDLKSNIVEIEVKTIESPEEAIEQAVRGFGATIDRLVKKKEGNIGDKLVGRLYEKMRMLQEAKLSNETNLLILDALKAMSWFTFFIANQNNSKTLLSLADNFISGNVSEEKMLKSVDELVNFDDKLNNFVKSGLMIAAS